MGICQICGSELDGAIIKCPRCETPHHQDCWDYLGGCSTYACLEKNTQQPRESAPPVPTRSVWVLTPQPADLREPPLQPGDQALLLPERAYSALCASHEPPRAAEPDSALLLAPLYAFLAAIFFVVLAARGTFKSDSLMYVVWGLLAGPSIVRSLTRGLVYLFKSWRRNIGGSSEPVLWAVVRGKGRPEYLTPAGRFWEPVIVMNSPQQVVISRQLHRAGQPCVHYRLLLIVGDQELDLANPVFPPQSPDDRPRFISDLERLQHTGKIVAGILHLPFRELPFREHIIASH